MISAIKRIKLLIHFVVVGGEPPCGYIFI